MQIVNVSQAPDIFNEALNFIWGAWGNTENKKFYEQCMRNSNGQDGIPRFYVAIMNGQIVGCYALLRNDINSRHDLSPWFACLYVEEKFRGQGIAATLLQHGTEQAKALRFNNLYLESNLNGFYERFGWKENGVAYDPFGNFAKIYEKSLEDRV
ncbi:GNAT family N-acetyltransferase [Ureibacillus sp. NPDC094379]